MDRHGSDLICRASVMDFGALWHLTRTCISPFMILRTTAHDSLFSCFSMIQTLRFLVKRNPGGAHLFCWRATGTEETLTTRVSTGILISFAFRLAWAYNRVVCSPQDG